MGIINLLVADDVSTVGVMLMGKTNNFLCNKIRELEARGKKNTQIKNILVQIFHLNILILPFWYYTVSYLPSNSINDDTTSLSVVAIHCYLPLLTFNKHWCDKLDFITQSVKKLHYLSSILKLFFTCLERYLHPELLITGNSFHFA